MSGEKDFLKFEQHPYGERPYTAEEEREAGEMYEDWAKKTEEEIKGSIETEEEINEESRKGEIPAKRVQIKGVREARQEMVRLEAEYDKYKFWTGDIGKHLRKEDRVKAKKDYGEAKNKYNEAQNKLLKFYLEKAQAKWTGEEGRTKFEEFRNEVIFRRAFSRERERINQAKQEVLSDQDQSRFKNILGRVGQEFNKIPKGRRWVYTALLGTGAALGAGAIAAPAALGYAGFRFGRAALASTSAVGIKKLGDELEKVWLKGHGKKKREEEIKESLVEQMEKVNDFEQMSKLLMEKREDRDEKLAKLIKQQKYWRVGKMAATIGAGGGIAFCAGHFDLFGREAEAAQVHDQLNVEEDGKVIRIPIPKEEAAAGPSDAAAETRERTYQSPFKVPDEIKETIEASEEEIPPEIKEPLPEGMETPVKYPGGEPYKPIDLKADEQAAAEISPDVAKPEPFQIAEKVEIKKGDSVWTVAEKYLEGNKVFQQLSDSGDKNTIEALQTYNIDRVKDVIVTNPQVYGLPENIDIDELTSKQLKGINWEKAFTDTFPEGKGLTTGLSEEQINNIAENNETLRTFFKDHPSAPRTSENYEAVLKGDGITGEEEAVVEPVTEEAPIETAKEELTSAEKLAQERLEAKTRDIYREKLYAFGDETKFDKDWPVIQERIASDILAGKFGEPIDGLDQFEINNRYELQDYLKEAQETIGQPEKNETVKDFLTKYEQNKLQQDLEIDEGKEEISLAEVNKKLEEVAEKVAGSSEILDKQDVINNYNMISDIPDTGKRISLLELFKEPNEQSKLELFKGTDVLEHDRVREVIAIPHDDKLELHYNIKNAPDFRVYINNNGTAFIDGPAYWNESYSSLKDVNGILKWPLNALERMEAGETGVGGRGEFASAVAEGEKVGEVQAEIPDQKEVLTEEGVKETVKEAMPEQKEATVEAGMTKAEKLPFEGDPKRYLINLSSRSKGAVKGIDMIRGEIDGYSPEFKEELETLTEKYLKNGDLTTGQRNSINNLLKALESTEGNIIEEPIPGAMDDKDKTIEEDLGYSKIVEEDLSKGKTVEEDLKKSKMVEEDLPDSKVLEEELGNKTVEKKLESNTVEEDLKKTKKKTFEEKI